MSSADRASADRQRSWWPTWLGGRTLGGRTRSRIRSVHILGERNSGTKLLHRCLNVSLKRRYLSPLTASYAQLPLRLPSGACCHDKHLLHTPRDADLQRLAHMRDALFIIVLRDPCRWAASMWRFPHQRCSTTNCTGEVRGFVPTYEADVSEFLRSQWRDSVSRRLYSDPLAIRAHKLALYRRIANLSQPNVAWLSTEALLANPQRALLPIYRRYRLATTGARCVPSKPPVCLRLAAKDVAYVQRRSGEVCDNCTTLSRFDRTRVIDLAAIANASHAPARKRRRDDWRFG